MHSVDSILDKDIVEQEDEHQGSKYVPDLFFSGEVHGDEVRDGVRSKATIGGSGRSEVATNSRNLPQANLALVATLLALRFSRYALLHTDRRSSRCPPHH